VVQHVAHIPSDLGVDQVVVLGRKPLQGSRQRADGTAQLDDLRLEQVDAFDVGVRAGREDLLFHRVDIDLDVVGDLQVVVDDMIGDRVHDRVGAQLRDRG